MENLGTVVAAIIITYIGCLQGFIIFDFEELEDFMTFALPMAYVYGCRLVDGRRKSEGINRGRGT